MLNLGLPNKEVPFLPASNLEKIMVSLWALIFWKIFVIPLFCTLSNSPICDSVMCILPPRPVSCNLEVRQSLYVFSDTTSGFYQIIYKYLSVKNPHLVASPSLRIVRAGVRHILSPFALPKCSLWTDKIRWGKTPSFTDYGRLWIFSSLVWEFFRRYLSPLQRGLVGVHGDQTVLGAISHHVINYWKSWDHRHYQWGRLISSSPPCFYHSFLWHNHHHAHYGKKNCGWQAQKAFCFLASNKIFPFSQIIFASSLR